MYAVPLSTGTDKYVSKTALPYPLISYKGRTINLKEPVEVYRNLNSKVGKYTIRQFGLVVAHADRLMLQDAEFKVYESGRQRVLKTGRKNVHAWVRGHLVPSGMGIQPDDADLGLPSKITYDPYKHKHFVHLRWSGAHPVKKATCVLFTEEEVTAAYTAE